MPPSPAPEGDALYRLAHEQVFQRPARDPLLSAVAGGVTEAARRLGVSLEVYFYACLMGHQISCPERAFRAPYLLGPTAEKRVKFYRSHALKRFHALDATSLRHLAGHGADHQRDAFLASETLFGSWIVNERCRRGGNGAAALYANRECAFPATWLAVEPSYAQWRSTQTERPYLGTDEDGQPVFNEIGRHRHAVSQVPNNTRSALLALRDKVLPLAAAQVLQKHGVSPRQLLIQSPVTAAFPFWLRLGDALLQLRLFHLVHPS